MADLSQIELNNDTYNLKDSECRQNLTALISVLSTILEEAAPDSFPIYDTVSGNVAAITDGADDLPVKSLTAEIEPIQEGTGTPSITNIRNISGSTSSTIIISKDNIFDKDNVIWINHKLIDDEGNIVTNTSYKYTNNYYKIPSTTILTFSYDKKAVSQIGLSVAFYNENKNFISRVVAIKATTTIGRLKGIVTTPENACYLRFSCGDNSTNYTNYQIEIGETNGVYKAYNSNQFTINWQTEAGTIYGGSVKYNGDGTWTITSNYGYGETNSEGKFARIDGVVSAWSANRTNTPYTYCSINASNTAVEDGICICNMYPASIVTSSSTDSIFWTYRAPSNSRLAFRDSSIWAGSANQAQQTTAVTDYFANLYTQGIKLQAAWKLSTPTTYTITTEQLIKTFHGINNIWSNTGDVTVEYPVDTNLYINKKIQQALQ